MRLLLYNTKTGQNYVRILGATNKAEAGNAYTITAPDPEDDTHTPDANGWYHGFLTEYTADSEPAFVRLLADSPEELVVHGYDAVAKRGYVIFKSGCPDYAFLIDEDEQKGYPITTVAIQNGVTVIGEIAFGFCTSLTTVSLPSTLTDIWHAAFAMCTSLESITIPEGVTYVDKQVFYGCSSLKTVYCLPTTPPSLGDDPFYMTDANLKIYVPAGSVDAYKEDLDWSEYKDCITSIP